MTLERGDRWMKFETPLVETSVLRDGKLNFGMLILDIED